ncbi:molybdate ABC transporter substrate-binding protein [Corynebacterium massiliense]|uniref:molybdate ABC transporter substrate-binding protein n=1 Tax=Corynebacterium massiliense TaxID=441501 RepID=UPI0023530E31|nr:molybdate ABC transporter substrate-binding protein [Corynebacterium massiliense]
MNLGVLKKKKLPIIAAIAAGAAAALVGCQASDTATEGAGSETSGSKADTLNVLAASSTRVLNDDLQKAADDADLDTELSFVNAGSSTLVQQLSDGAPGDLLITANQKTMDDAVERGTVSDPRVLATNEMVMVVPKGNPAGIKSVRDITDETNFVVCDPQVPCGDISEDLMKDNNVTARPDSQEHQVADVLSRVSTGEADAGWVYSTDAAAAGDKVEVIKIDHSAEHRNDIVGAVAKDAAHKEKAERVLDLLDKDFDTQWRDHGFEPNEG